MQKEYSSQARIYFPGMVSGVAISDLQNYLGKKNIEEIRMGLELPAEKTDLIKVWHVEFQNAPLSANLFAQMNKMELLQYDETIQFRTYPRFAHIWTTQYDRSAIQRAQLEPFMCQDKYHTRIYQGEYPRQDPLSSKRKIDGTVFIITYHNLDHIENLLSNWGIECIITEEHQIAQSNGS